MACSGAIRNWHLNSSSLTKSLVDIFLSPMKVCIIKTMTALSIANDSSFYESVFASFLFCLRCASCRSQSSLSFVVEVFRVSWISMLREYSLIKSIIMLVFHIQRLRMVTSALSSKFSYNPFFWAILALTKVFVAPAIVFVEYISAVSSKVSQVIRKLGLELILFIGGMDTLVSSISQGSLDLFIVLQSSLACEELTAGRFSLCQIPHLGIASKLLFTSHSFLLLVWSGCSLAHSCLLAGV